MNHDSRLRQHFNNYRRALAALNDAAALAQQRPLSELEQLGLIHTFGITHERAWNLLRDFLDDQGVSGLIGPRDAIRAAVANDLIVDSATWMDMINDRGLSPQSYQLEVASRIASNVMTRFHPAFTALSATMNDRTATRTNDKFDG